MQKNLKTLLHRNGHIINKITTHEFIFQRYLNFWVSDSMNDFILTLTIEFSIKSYINSEIPRS